MKRIAKFEKVSLEQFKKDWIKIFENKFTENQIEEIYNQILWPKRATKGSAGYDFYSPLTFTLNPGETIQIPTGIRCKMDEEWVFKLYPRSNLGFKYRLQLNNTVGIIDSDYFYSDNEGHIMAKITNDSKEDKIVAIFKEDRFMQGIFLEYGITIDDNVKTIRNGGLGSTSEKGK